jgi:hypothetical protein
VYRGSVERVLYSRAAVVAFMYSAIGAHNELTFSSLKLNACSSLAGKPASKFFEDPRALDLNVFVVEYISTRYRRSEKFCYPCARRCKWLNIFKGILHTDS